jgi:hypothetical protein
LAAAGRQTSSLKTTINNRFELRQDGLSFCISHAVFAIWSYRICDHTGDGAGIAGDRRLLMTGDLLYGLMPIFAALIWYCLFERIPFEKLGSLNEVLEILKWESDDLQAKYLTQFSMRRYQWFILNRRHAKRIQMSLGLSGMRQAGFSPASPAALRTTITIKR